MAGGGAGGDEELVKADLFATVEGDGFAGGVEVGYAAAGANVDLVLAVPFGGVDEGVRAACLSAEIFLTERGGVIGAVDLLADHHQVGAVVEGADGFGGRVAGEAAADQKIFDMYAHLRNVGSI